MIVMAGGSSGVYRENGHDKAHCDKTRLYVYVYCIARLEPGTAAPLRSYEGN